MRRLPFLLATLLLIALLPGQAESRSAAQASSSAADNNMATPAETFAAMRKSFQAGQAEGLHARYQFHFRDPQAGNWWIEIDGGACKMGQGEIRNPDVTFECTGDDWVKMCNGTLGGFHAWVTGRMRMRGSRALARKMDDLFP